MTQKEALVRQKEKVQQKKVEEANQQLESAKTDFKTKLEAEKKRCQEKVDKMKLELTEQQLCVDELRLELKKWKDKYEVLRDGME